MSRPLISVIIPTYNHASYLKEAMGSVLGQTYSNLELIVIDNFSTDDTESIVQSLDDDRIRYLKFSNNGVIAASRNHGIKEAKGEFIAFLDSDDYWFKDKLALQLKALQENEKAGISFCLFKTKSDNSINDEKILGPKKNTLPAEIYERLIKVNFIVSSSVFVRKSALDEVGVFDESKELVCSEDFDLWLRIAHKYEAAFVPVVGGIYRIHENNESSNNNRLGKAIAVIDKHIREKRISQEKGDYAKASFYFQGGWVIIGENQALAREYFKKSLTLSGFHPKLFLINSIGFCLSLFPRIYIILRKRKIDQNLGKKLINSQSL